MKIRLRHLAILISFVSLWICADANAAEVRAWLDRNAMQMGETVTLNVEVTGDNGAAKPDFGVLARDFNLLGSQSSTSMNIVNGQASSKLLWAIGLEPKHAGTLSIPALDVAGQHTQPLALNVQAAVAGTGGKAGDDVYIEVAVDPRAPYVQQQVRLTVKLYFALNLSDGSLDDPQADGLVVKKLGQDANFAADVGGRRYRVLERHYALLPEKSGPATVPAITFRGHAVDPSDINSFFSRGRSISARADAITLDVRPRPAASGTDAWLPARSVTLGAEGIDATKTAKVGEPLTLTLHLKAQGLGFEQLPELALPKIDGADVYPDKTTTQNRDDGEWLYGERERKFAIVPNRAGSLSLPAISIGWWDTAHDRVETAEVPALNLNVEPAAGPDVSNVANEPKAAVRQNPLAPAAAAGATPGPSDQGAEADLWRRLAFFALALWALTLTAWIVWLVMQRRRAQVETPVSAVVDTTASARSAFRDACTNRDLPSAARALLAWARAIDPQVRNLGDLARRVSDPGQASAIADLDRALYGAGNSEGLCARLAATFRNGPDLASSAAPTPSSPLPPLYPFRT
ncbi:MAG: BatD family protein [Rudaea sp.]|nr:BatD family protein [Rudaea sp.]